MLSYAKKNRKYCRPLLLLLQLLLLATRNFVISEKSATIKNLRNQGNKNDLIFQRYEEVVEYQLLDETRNKLHSKCHQTLDTKMNLVVSFQFRISAKYGVPSSLSLLAGQFWLRQVIPVWGLHFGWLFGFYGI